MNSSRRLVDAPHPHQMPCLPLSCAYGLNVHKRRSAVRFACYLSRTLRYRTGAVGSWKAFFCLAPKSGEMNEMTPNKRLTHLRGGFQEPQGMQYSYLGSFVSAVNNLRFCTRRVLEGTVHRTNFPLCGSESSNFEKCLENLNLKNP